MNLRGRGALIAGTLVVPLPAHATYSTVAMERATGRYGAVSASCVGLSVLRHVYASVPDHGAVLTQSYLVDGDASQARALQALGQGAHASDVLDAMTDPQFDANFSLRQYVVIDAIGDLAGFTGGGAEPFAGHLDASDHSFRVGTAGNFLTGAEVLEAAAFGFGDDAGCDLEEHLVNALAAASAAGLGDARCVVDGRPAQSVWLHVQGSNGEGDLDIAVDAALGIDPTVEALTRFSEWRSGHPCPVAPETPRRSAPRSDRNNGCAMALGKDDAIEGWLWLLVLLGRRRVRTTSDRERYLGTAERHHRQWIRSKCLRWQSSVRGFR